MTTATCPTPRIALHRPWWVRAADALRTTMGRGKPTEDDVYAALSGLSEHTLRDIGAPDWVHERARVPELQRLQRHLW